MAADLLQEGQVGSEKSRADHGYAHHFVGVPAEAVREVRAVHEVFVGGGEEAGAAPRGVDVEPHVVRLADGGEVG